MNIIKNVTKGLGNIVKGFKPPEPDPDLEVEKPQRACVLEPCV